MKHSVLDSPKPLPRTALASALAFFIIIQTLGLLLRWQFVQGIPGFNYGFFLHTHSHVALLGWVHAVLALLIPQSFLAPTHSLKVYHRNFWCSQATVLGMLLSFPIQGYAAVSITFSTLFLLCSYHLAYRLWKDIPRDASASRTLLMASLFFLVLSSVGPWSLGPIMALKMAKSPLYHLAIYFYLHFQYNGWFSLACAALGLRYLEQKQKVSLPAARDIQCLIWSSALTYSLSTLWAHPPTWVYVLGILSAVLQLYSCLRIAHACKSQLQKKHLSTWPGRLLGLSLLCFAAKISLQALTAIPYFAHLAAQHRPLVIFYLHLVLLGAITPFLWAMLFHQRALGSHKPQTRWGISLYLLGFIGSEGLLLYQGLAQWLQLPLFSHFYTVLFAVSCSIPCGFTLLSSTLNLTLFSPNKGAPS